MLCYELIHRYVSEEAEIHVTFCLVSDEVCAKSVSDAGSVEDGNAEKRMKSEIISPPGFAALVSTVHCLYVKHSSTSSPWYSSLAFTTCFEK